MKINPTRPPVNLGEPIKSTDIVLLEKIKNQRTAIGIKKTAPSKEMPRLDQQGTTNKPLEGKQGDKSSLTTSDWKWLRDVYKHAIMIDEINKTARRKNQVEDIKLASEEHARILTDLAMNERILANAAAKKELNRILKKHEIQSDYKWQEWIDKIDRKTAYIHRELLVLFLRHLGFKLGYIPLASNQKHLTEVKESLSSVFLRERHEERLLRTDVQNELNAFRQKLERIDNIKKLQDFKNTAADKIQEIKEQNLLQFDADQRTRLEMLLRHLGFKLGYIRLPTNQKHLTEFKEKPSKIALRERHENHVIETQEQLISETDAFFEDKHWTDRSVTKLVRHQEAVHTRELFELLLKSWGFKLGFVRLSTNQKHLTEVKKSISEEMSESQDMVIELHADEQKHLDETREEIERMGKNQIESTAEEKIGEHISQKKSLLTEQAIQDLSEEKRAHLLAMGYKPGFIPTPAKALELSLKEEDVARLKVEKESKKDPDQKPEDGLKLAQLQSATQLAQAQAALSEIKSRQNHDASNTTSMNQKIKIAK